MNEWRWIDHAKVEAFTPHKEIDVTSAAPIIGIVKPFRGRLTDHITKRSENPSMSSFLGKEPIEPVFASTIKQGIVKAPAVKTRHIVTLLQYHAVPGVDRRVPRLGLVRDAIVFEDQT
jgi:hypothetical protein